MEQSKEQPWVPERVVDEALARELMRAQFPELPLVKIELLGVGWDNTAYLVNGSWVFRFPRRQIAVALIEHETRLLPALAPRVPLPIPVPEFVGRPEERFPWPFAGYRLLPGRTACSAALTEDQRVATAEPLARFLAALHAFPAQEAASLGAGGDELARMDVGFRAPKARASLAEFEQQGLLPRSERERLERVIDATPTGAPRPPAVLVHGDLYVRHLLVDEHARPAGVIDWGDIHLGDRAVDLAIAYSFLPPAAHARFRQVYGEQDAVTWQLARFRALYHSANLFRFAHHTGDPDLLREATRALRQVQEGP